MLRENNYLFAMSFIFLIAGCGPEEATGTGEPIPCESAAVEEGDRFADAVVSVTYGTGAGFGQENMPGIVLGPPVGGGFTAGSFDVVSLGANGVIVLEFDDILLGDGPGVDLLVFENAFNLYPETGYVAVSNDGTTWHEWPCEPANSAEGYPGCAGVGPVYSNPANEISPIDPAVAGGNGFDLHDLGLTEAKYVRIRDSGANNVVSLAPYKGFDLDAVAIVNPKTDVECEQLP